MFSRGLEAPDSGHEELYSLLRPDQVRNWARGILLAQKLRRLIDCIGDRREKNPRHARALMIAFRNTTAGFHSPAMDAM
jgi:hypothetical protein